MADYIDFFLRLKSRYPLVFILFSSFCISLLIAVVHITFRTNPVGTILALTLILSSIFSYFDNQNKSKYQSKIISVIQTNSTANNQRTIDTNSGDYNENIQGNYIKGDNINQHIDIGGSQVEINNDISPSEICDEFRDILTRNIAQSSNVLDAICKFQQELTEELRKHPEVKVYLNGNIDSNEEELVNNILKILLSQEFYSIESLNNTGQLVTTNLVKDENKVTEKYKNSIQYRNYTIELLKGKHDRWIYKIYRPDFSILENKTRITSYKEEDAIKKAKKEINSEMEEEFNKVS
ncbi:hypothetical protein BV378_00150 [Nostoc sp. RF31YmG]|nr:hypothetical protein BV378_00150 [Nostoc sp. RF31YmG]